MTDLSIDEIKLGINISNTSIEVMQITRGRKVVAFGRHRSFVGCVEKGWLNESEIADALIQVLTKNIPEYRSAFEKGFVGKKKIEVFLSVPESKTYIYNFEVQRLDDEDEFKKSIVTYVKKYLLTEIDELCWDYLIVNNNFNTNKVSIVFVGVPKPIIGGLMNVADMAGLEVCAIENESLSLGRSLLGKNIEGGVIIADFGVCETNLTLFYADRVPFVSATVNFGGDDINKILSEEHDRPLEDIEKEKKKKDFLTGGTCNNGLMSIVKEIDTMGDYFTKKTGLPVKKVYLTVVSSLLNGVLGFFKKNIKCEVSFGDPFFNLHGVDQNDTHEQWSLLSNVTGLALRFVDNGVENINLKFRDYKKESFIEKWWN